MIYFLTFSTTTNFYATMSGDETAVLVITKDKTKKGKDCFKDQFHFQYTLNRTDKKCTYWRCSDRSCTASIAKDVTAELILKD